MRDVIHRIEAFALRALLAILSPFPMAVRRAVIGWIAGMLVRLPAIGGRATRNLALVWPHMPAPERRALTLAVGRNTGRTLAGVWCNDAMEREFAHLTLDGPGLPVLRAAKAEGRGAILLSGHFGQWEVIRHALRREGMETGAIYRPNNNPHYNPLFRDGLRMAGEPIVPRGPAGLRDLMRHLQAGGFMAFLMDQHVYEGVPIPFLGVPARTSLAPADLALRFDIPLVPCFAPWEAGGLRLIVETPISPSDPETMMRDFNDRLSSWVTRYPSQWHWLHRRWKGQMDGSP
ncbi:MAG: lysophospholipid acyltransferase family protein [Pseudomonadota bacterium]